MKKTDKKNGLKIINVMAASIDGYVAVHEGQSDKERMGQGFTESEDREHLKKLIRSADAVILGSQTLIAGGGALDIKREDGTYPVWITFTNKGIPEEEKFWTQKRIPRWLISRDKLEGEVVHIEPVEDAEPDAGTVPEAGEEADSTRVECEDTKAGKVPINYIYYSEDPVSITLAALKKAGFHRVLLFGGGYINRMFYEADAVDELILTLCPVLVADDEAVPLVNPKLINIHKFELKSVEAQGNLIFIHYIASKLLKLKTS